MGAPSGLNDESHGNISEQYPLDNGVPWIRLSPDSRDAFVVYSPDHDRQSYLDRSAEFSYRTDASVSS